MSAALRAGPAPPAPLDPHLVATPRQVADALGRLGEEDAVSLELLSESACALLLAASAGLPYREARPVIGEGERAVRQEFEICMPVPAGGPFQACAAAVERLVARALAEMADPPLAVLPPLNDLVVQRYAPGSLGITAHRDHVRYRHLVAIVTLTGRARFFVSKERTGAGAREIDIPPCSLLLMRAPGFAGREDRPFHLLSDVTETRVCVGLRHDVRAGEPV